MKRFFTVLFVVLGAYTTFAKTYTGKLVVYINGNIADNSTATINVDQQGDGTYKLSLANFSINLEGQKQGVGTINIPATPFTQGSTKLLQANTKVKIEEGSTTGPWIGPVLGEVPINLLAQESGNKLNANIGIDFQGMTIKVVFGEGYQVPNGDFETFGGKNNEPNRWHSFESVVTSWLTGAAKGQQTRESMDVRPGSSGKKSVLVFSRDVIIATANGTLTTGRLNAGSISASSTSNNSFLNLSNKDKDVNGDPFYTELSGRPDSLTLWVKFKQGKPSADHPYATAKAVITDGTYYQLPEDKTYKNKMAEAINNEIADTKGEWKRLSIPFKYVNNSIDPKAILVTLSTNADAGEGSGSDELYVDDLELVYNFGVEGISIKGQALANFAENTTEYTHATGNITANDIMVKTKGQGMLVAKTVENGKATVLVASNDLSKYRLYTINVTTGIDNLPSVEANKQVEIYTLDGVRVNNTNRKGVYIIKDAQGKTRKVVKQ